MYAISALLSKLVDQVFLNNLLIKPRLWTLGFIFLPEIVPNQHVKMWKIRRRNIWVNYNREDPRI